MRVLVIEPDPATLRALERGLKACGFVVSATDDAEEGISLASHYEHEVVLAAGGPEFRTVRALRTAKVDAGLIVLGYSARVHDVVQALRLGADDYLPKPFNFDELVARIRALVRRRREYVVEKIACGDLTIDVDGKSVHYAGRRINLTGKEYALLELLALRRGTCLSKGTIFDALYGGPDEPELKIVDVFVCHVRRKIERFAGNSLQFIETVWGQGYMMPLAPFEGSVRRGRPQMAVPVTSPRPGAPTRSAAHATA